MEYPYSGEVLIHAVPASSARSVEWMLAETMEYRLPFQWSAQPALESQVRTSFSWQGFESTGAELASALANWQEIYFEVIQDASVATSASRWLHVPGLGLKHRHTDSAGNYLVNEVELQTALANSTNSMMLNLQIKNLLATQWEDSLEPLRSLMISSPMVTLRQVG